ncbi:hypothetical protein TEA_006253 [Camellia sinensis var. sinensis]|uniref:S-adenosylmethionine-dependent methyltransferase domain-containing protein n=1 Tax=Camellia sinensis var. sinensis TaxID=542762 RepID=A0A4S4DVB0_CAMSN|nr:hypothetical protein TEA_006253 [Camellia sinensis var. sinensis]
MEGGDCRDCGEISPELQIVASFPISSGISKLSLDTAELEAAGDETFELRADSKFAYWSVDLSHVGLRKQSKDCSGEQFISWDENRDCQFCTGDGSKCTPALRKDPSCALNIEKLLETRIHAAIQLRRSLGLPSANTNAYRLVNSEGDRLSGLIIDIFGDLAVIASSAAWVEKYKPQIKACISGLDGINYISWRPSIEILKEEGLYISDSKEIYPPSPLERVKVMENGISYLISLEGQKTGFYADQRENRQFISTISDGQKVLDMYCYSGGFALNASRGGAMNVTGVDSSLPALELANENIALNNLDPGKISVLRCDATDFMKDALSRNETWDIIIMDPPKLAPRRKAAASIAGRKITVIRQAGAAYDHPIDPSYPEGAYLSNILLRVL